MTNKPTLKVVKFLPNKDEQTLFARAEKAVAHAEDVADFSEFCKLAITRYLDGELAVTAPATASVSAQEVVDAVAQQLESSFSKFRKIGEKVDAALGAMPSGTASQGIDRTALSSEADRIINAVQSVLNARAAVTQADLNTQTERVLGGVKELTNQFYSLSAQLPERLASGGGDAGLKAEISVLSGILRGDQDAATQYLSDLQQTVQQSNAAASERQAILVQKLYEMTQAQQILQAELSKVSQNVSHDLAQIAEHISAWIQQLAEQRNPVPAQGTAGYRGSNVAAEKLQSGNSGVSSPQPNAPMGGGVSGYALSSTPVSGGKEGNTAGDVDMVLARIGKAIRTQGEF